MPFPEADLEYQCVHVLYSGSHYKTDFIMGFTGAGSKSIVALSQKITKKLRNESMHSKCLKEITRHEFSASCSINKRIAAWA